MYGTGRMIDDPELRYTPHGTSICSFKVYSQKKDDIIDCVIWNESAEKLVKELRNGDIVRFEGYSKVRNWRDYRGRNRTKREFIVKSFVILKQNTERKNK